MSTREEGTEFGRGVQDRLAGRLLMAALFLSSAFAKIVHFDEAAATALGPLAWATTAGVESFGGMALALGYYCRWAAAALGAVVVFQAGSPVGSVKVYSQVAPGGRIVAA